MCVWGEGSCNGLTPISECVLLLRESEALPDGGYLPVGLSEVRFVLMYAQFKLFMKQGMFEFAAQNKEKQQRQGDAAAFSTSSLTF